jgi:hypothetical protein
MLGYRVTMERTVIGGVKAFILTPKAAIRLQEPRYMAIFGSRL